MKARNARYNIRVQGAMLRRMEQAKEVAGIDTDAELARYLINRGLEAMTRQIDLHLMRAKLEKEMSAQELLPFVEKAMEGAE